MRPTNNLEMLGFKQSHADPCVFRKFVAENDLLALTVTKDAMETFVRELR